MAEIQHTPFTPDEDDLPPMGELSEEVEIKPEDDSKKKPSFSQKVKGSLAGFFGLQSPTPAEKEKWNRRVQKLGYERGISQESSEDDVDGRVLSNSGAAQGYARMCDDVDSGGHINDGEDDAHAASTGYSSLEDDSEVSHFANTKRKPLEPVWKMALDGIKNTFKGSKVKKQSSGSPKSRSVAPGVASKLRKEGTWNAAHDEDGMDTGDAPYLPTAGVESDSFFDDYHGSGEAEN